MTDTNLLLQEIDNSGLKKGAIAHELGLTVQGFMRKVFNESEFKASEIKKICEILNINSLVKRERIFFTK